MLYGVQFSNGLEGWYISKTFLDEKFLDAGIQDVSTSISIVLDLIEMSSGDAGDESDKHI